MLNSFFKGVFDSGTSAALGLTEFLYCLTTAMLLGLALAFLYKKIGRGSQGFIATLALLPCVVCVVIMLVNGNLGAGVAVAGAFSLVRFRSAPGSAQEIGAIFIAMAVGLITGMGYLGFATLFMVSIAIFMLISRQIGLGEPKNEGLEKLLRVTIPEELDFTSIFDDLFQRFTQTATLVEVKSTGMGSLFRLSYLILLKDITQEKQLLDAVRCRNGNLEVLLSRRAAGTMEL